MSTSSLETLVSADVLELPTAVHWTGDGHATAFSCAVAAPGGTRSGWALHRVPSQVSANGDIGVPPVVSKDPTTGLNEPTDIHAVADEHDTPLSVLGSGPGGSGTARPDQRLPRQRAAKSPTPVRADPIAVQTERRLQETAFSGPRTLRTWFAGLRSDHLEPREPSTRARVLPSCGLNEPTAVQAAGRVQTTETN